ncbi:hypothetical protein EV426DRAFT_577620 [Tirmania nivea]|nr:hypothetical protein EV426DRAFT_577620 [Tirmania nivea]
MASSPSTNPPPAEGPIPEATAIEATNSTNRGTGNLTALDLRFIHWVRNSENSPATWVTSALPVPEESRIQCIKYLFDIWKFPDCEDPAFVETSTFFKNSDYKYFKCANPAEFAGTNSEFEPARSIVLIIGSEWLQPQCLGSQALVTPICSLRFRLRFTSWIVKGSRSELDPEGKLAYVSLSFQKLPLH